MSSFLKYTSSILSKTMAPTADPNKKQTKKKVPLVIQDQKMLQALGKWSIHQIFYLSKIDSSSFSDSTRILQTELPGMVQSADGS
jgi:hypothetical protein